MKSALQYFGARSVSALADHLAVAVGAKLEGPLSFTVWRDAPVKVLGVRGYGAVGGAAHNTRGIYDDRITIYAGENQEFSFVGNTDPSAWRRGVATLAAPQVVLYAPGFHGYGRRTGHAAFRQASPVVIRRDGNTGAGKLVRPGVFTDAGGDPFWINLHRGGHSGTSSAGCQTIAPQLWPAFHERLTGLLQASGLRTFPYLLV